MLRVWILLMVRCTRYNIMWLSWISSVSSINKTDGHDITEILLKVVLKQRSPNPLTRSRIKHFVSASTNLNWQISTMIINNPRKPLNYVWNQNSILIYNLKMLFIFSFNIFFISLKSFIYTVLEMKLWIYWSESNSCIYFIYLNKNWKIYWSKQSFTGLGPEDRCSSWGLLI